MNSDTQTPYIGIGCLYNLFNLSTNNNLYYFISHVGGGWKLVNSDAQIPFYIGIGYIASFPFFVFLISVAFFESLKVSLFNKKIKEIYGK